MKIFMSKYTKLNIAVLVSSYEKSESLLKDHDEYFNPSVIS